MNLVVNLNVDLIVNLIVGLIVNLSVDIQYVYYCKVVSTNASRFVTRLVYMHTQNDIF